MLSMSHHQAVQRGGWAKSPTAQGRRHRGASLCCVVGLMWVGLRGRVGHRVCGSSHRQTSLVAWTDVVAGTTLLGLRLQLRFRLRIRDRYRNYTVHDEVYPRAPV